MRDKLTKEYKKWCENNNIPYKYSADELLYEDIKLTDDQKAWLNNFIDRWEKYS